MDFDFFFLDINDIFCSVCEFKKYFSLYIRLAVHLALYLDYSFYVYSQI